jgi:hypothetical protein
LGLILVAAPQLAPVPLRPPAIVGNPDAASAL